MDRTEVKQHVLDALGKILVDKTLIQKKDDALLTELLLDEKDFEAFFDSLHDDVIDLPQQTKTEISGSIENPLYSQLTLHGLVDLILQKMKHRKDN